MPVLGMTHPPDTVRGTLWRWRGEVDRIDLVVLALVFHAVDAGGISIDPGIAVKLDCAVFPASFPELVHNLHVFLGDVVTAVVLRLLSEAHAACGAVEITGDDVPADAAFRQVIERRHAAGERIGRFVGQVAGDAKSQVLRGVGHRRDQQQWIVHRDLHGVADRGVRRTVEYVVDAKDVSKKQAIEQAALQRARERHPVLEIGVMRRLIARVRPQTVLNMADTVHVEGVEADLPRHGLRHRGRSRPWPRRVS